MKELFIQNIIDMTIDFLDNNQRIRLKEILICFCDKYKIVKNTDENSNTRIINDNRQILNQFLSSKEIEGCSGRILKYYRDNIDKMLNSISKSINEITTEDLRNYLSKYKDSSNVSTVTIDNIRRVMSSFLLG